MSQQELLKTVIQKLEAESIDYMLTGSFVSSLQGEPRLTHDIDIVVALSRSEVKKISTTFTSPRYYLDEKSIIDALAMNSMFNVLDVEEGDKIDFWILTNDPFDTSRFARKYIEEVFGMRLKISTPEDTIIAKLRWSKLSGGSEKQFGDALRVFEVQREKLDLQYIEKWVRQLMLEELWKHLQAAAK